MKTSKSLMAASFALLLLAACGSSGLGGVLGGGDNGQSYQIRGVVDSVDPGSRSVYLTNVNGYTTMLSNGGGGSTARVYFDDSTQVEYQGRAYRPQDLERGDEVTVNVDESGNRLLAESMTVTYDASNGSTPNTSSPTDRDGDQLSTIRGTVYSVDSSRHTLQLDAPSWISGFQRNPTGSRVTIYYDANAVVDVQGHFYPVTNLERGDVVDVQVYGNGSSLQTQQMVLVRDVNR
jgi:hypothetical protein